MSGFEPLAVLGLACNILQLIEVGCNTIKLAKSIYQSSSPSVNKALEDNAAVLRTISGEVKAIQRPASLSRLEQQLVTTADKCFAAARDLQEEVVFLLSNAKQNKLAATLKVVTKTTWRKRRLERLKESLESAEKLMTKTLLAQIWSRTHAAELDVSEVKDDLRAFIQQYQTGTSDIRQLVSSESLMTREHISASSNKQLEALGDIQKQVTRLTVEVDLQVDQAQRERLLRSLKFPAFNERRNQVSEAHESTFEWIFIGDDGPSQEDVEESELEDSDWEESDLEDFDLPDPSEVNWDLFSNWLSSTADIYWISGKPGSGKTTLVKYVLDHPKTAVYLNTWSPKALIISHFLWRPGTQMQQNIKGLLCGLLHQLLDNSAIAVEYLLRNIQSRTSGMKEADTDWSVPELRKIVLEILSIYERPICIFVDGLDEVHPSDGPVDLLDLIEMFPRYGNTKLCLSSRPEHILEQRLSSHPHLRLEHLTRKDLERYAETHLELATSAFDESQSNSLLDDRKPFTLLVDKAEGVFLWLVLAIKSINKGFMHGDTSAMIKQRIECLPGDLITLYKDMWSRACEDNPMAYRRMAALYFRLLLISNHRARTLPQTEDLLDSSNLLHLMLASTSVADQLLDNIDTPLNLVPEERLLEHCRVVERGTKLYCFGLIETYQQDVKDEVVGWYGSRYSKLWARCGRRSVQFVHRTAQDFLCDTVEGQEILNYYSTSEIPLLYKWIRAHLAISQLYADRGTKYNGAGATTLVSIFLEFLSHLPPGISESGDRDRVRTISFIENLCNAGQLLGGQNGAARFCGGVDFLNVLATHCPEDILSMPTFSTLSKAEMSEILLNVCRDDHNPRKTSTELLITTLLSKGANANWRGSTFEPGWDPYPTVSQVRTPFTQYLSSILYNLASTRAGWTDTSIGPESVATMLRNLYTLLSHSADLGDSIDVVLPFGTSEDIYINKDALTSPFLSISHGLASMRGGGRSYLVLRLSAGIALKALLHHLQTEFVQSWREKVTEYEHTLSLLVSNREYLANWSQSNHGRVIAILTRRVVSNKRHLEWEPLWCMPSEGYPIGLVDELMEEIEKCLLDDLKFSPQTRPGRMIGQLVQRIPWTLKAAGLEETCAFLTETGVLALVDYELNDVQGWVDKFQRRLFADGSFVDKAEVRVLEADRGRSHT